MTNWSFTWEKRGKNYIGVMDKNGIKVEGNGLDDCAEKIKAVKETTEWNAKLQLMTYERSGITVTGKDIIECRKLWYIVFRQKEEKEELKWERRNE